MYFIDEVCSFEGPIGRNFFCPDLHLLAKNLISDFFTVSAVVRPATEHELISNDANSVIVNWKRMVLPAHDFRCHISRSAAGVCAVVWLHHSCNPQISYSNVPFIIKHQVFRLDVAVDDVVEMQEFKTDEDAGNKELCLQLLEPTAISHMVT